MKKFLLTTVYISLVLIPLVLLMKLFEIADSWWIEVIVIGFSLFMGSFIYTQFHGTQVMELKHLESTIGTNKFQVLLRVSGHGVLNILGEYERVPYTDLELQRKLFKTLNSFPGNKYLQEFVNDAEEKFINVTVDDPELPHPINFTQVKLERHDSQSGISSTRENPKGFKSRAELEKELEGLSNYEIGMKLWNQEQELLAKARKDGMEDQLIAHWKSIGRPKMKRPPTRED